MEGLIDLSGNRVRATCGVFSVWGTPQYATNEDYLPWLASCFATVYNNKILGIRILETLISHKARRTFALLNLST